MAWQTVLLSIEGQVKGCSREGRRPSSLDGVCISLNRGRGRGPYWEGKGWLGCPKAKEAESQPQEEKASCLALCLVGDLLFDLTQAACSRWALSFPIFAMRALN